MNATLRDTRPWLNCEGRKNVRISPKPTIPYPHTQRHEPKAPMDPHTSFPPTCNLSPVKSRHAGVHENHFIFSEGGAIMFKIAAIKAKGGDPGD